MLVCVGMSVCEAARHPQELLRSAEEALRRPQGVLRGSQGVLRRAAGAPKELLSEGLYLPELSGRYKS